jgi:aspartokinase/homoserine dehydrogenase 1
MNILKFGGTSVGSQESINALIGLLKPNAQLENPVVVLSAMSGVTNALLEMAENARNLQEYGASLKEVEEKHFKVIRALLPASAQNPVLTKLKIFFNELEDILQSVYNLRELSPQTKDLILSYGERCSTAMISHIAKQQFPDALYVDGSELIKTDNNFGQAKVNTNLSEMLINDFYTANAR